MLEPPAAPVRWRGEAGAILTLAAPLAAAQIAQMIMGMTDAVMMGRIGTEALAAGGLGSNIALMMVAVSQGLLQSIQPIVAQARGAGDRSEFGRVLGGGFLAALLCAVPIVLVLTHIDRLLIAIGEPPAIAHLTLVYERAFAWGIPASLVQGVLRNYLTALARLRIVMLVSGSACLLNFGLNWVLVFGHLGMPALGLAGSGYSTTIVWWGMGVALALYSWRTRLLPPDLFGLGRREILRGFRAVVSLGWPIAGIIAVEVGLFSGSSLLIGYFGPVALAAHQICINFCALTYMVPLSIGAAATVRVGYHIGAGAFGCARRAGFAAIALGVGFMSLSALSIRLLARPIFALYLDRADPNFLAVETLGHTLIAIAALFQIFDGVQTVAAGALRGLKDTRPALLAGIAGYWLFGMPVGYGLGFLAGLGPAGLWWGFVAGLVAMAILLTLRFRYRSAELVAAAPAPAFAD